MVPHRHGGTCGADAGYDERPDAAFDSAASEDAALGAVVRRGIELFPETRHTAGHLTFVATNRAAGIRLCAWRDRGSVCIGASAARSLGR